MMSKILAIYNSELVQYIKHAVAVILTITDFISDPVNGALLIVEGILVKLYHKRPIV